MRKIKSDVSNQKMSEVLDLASFQSALTKEFKPRNEISRAAVESSVRLLAQQALSNQPLIQQDAVKTIQSIIFQIDNKLTEQLADSRTKCNKDKPREGWLSMRWHHGCFNRQVEVARCTSTSAEKNDTKSTA